MTYKRVIGLALGILSLSLALSACTRSLSSAPEPADGQQSLATPTIVGVLPTAMTEDAMSQLQAFGTQTAMAEQAAFDDATATPSPMPTETPAAEPATTAPEITATPVVVTPTESGGNTYNPPGNVPDAYTLQPGEFPYCIARRFDVNPDQLLAANGLTSDQGRIYYPGKTLTIPQNADPFPTDRALRAHPDIYSVQNANETIYSVACKYGDVDPLDLAAFNNLEAPYTLVVGQILEIP